jgi:hypothetical protein
MTRNTDPLDQRFEHLLREQMPSPAPDELSNLVTDLRQAYVAPFAPQVQNGHIGDLVMAVRQASANQPSPFRSRLNGVWYRLSKRFVAGSLVGKIVLASSVAMAATTGMAATGHLPNNIQMAVSQAAAQIGVSIPQPPPAPVNAQPPSPPAPKRPVQAIAPTSSPTPPPAAPVVDETAASAPTPSASPADACAKTIFATPPPPPSPVDPATGDPLEPLRQLTEEQLQLDELLKCLATTPSPAPAQPSGELGSAGLSELLESLLGGGAGGGF